MKIKARLTSKHNFRSEGSVIIFDTRADIESLEKDIEYSLEIRPFKQDRSLNQNALHWELCGQIARAVKGTAIQVHNKLLGDLRITMKDADGDTFAVCMKDNDEYLNDEKNHFVPTDKIEEKGGKIFRWYLLLKPSHLMDTSEMARLLDLTIQTAEELGIHTEPEIIDKAKEQK